METKVCTVCSVEKPLSEYHFRKDSNKHRNECKVCVCDRSKKYASDNIIKVRETKRNHRKLNKEKISKRNREYQIENRDTLKIKRNVWREENKERIQKQRSEFYLANKDRINEEKKRHYINNKAHYRARQSVYDEQNKERLREARRIWERKRLAEDISYRLQKSLRGRIRVAIKTKKAGKGTMELTGCTIDELRSHLENQFKPGMNWGNYGEWHIDHKIPISWFNMESDNCIKAACNYKNLQPMWAKDNIQKSNKFACSIL